MDEAIHPYDFESCQLPHQSVEQMLAIQQGAGGLQPTTDFFHERLNYNGEASFLEIDVDVDDVPDTFVLRSPMGPWKEEKMFNALSAPRLSSLVASVSISDVIRSPSAFTGSFNQESDQERVATPEVDVADDKRKVTDKWGFVVEDPSEAASSVPRGNSRSQNKLEEKWLDILRDWSSYSDEKKRRICKKRIRKGIPNRVRGEMWKVVMDVTEMRLENRDLFQRLLDKESEFENQIQIDIHRTLPRHIFFQEQGGMGQTSLFNSLKAYSVYNQKVGYCQGMGFIMAMFLLYMTEEDAFFLLAQLINKHDMSGLFEPGFPALIQCFYVHDQLLRSTLPALATHFENQMIAASMYATKWYPTMFSISLPFEFTIRIWDLFMVEGFKVLYRAALTILRLLSKELLKVEFEGIMDRLRNLSKYLTVTPDEFITVMMENSNITDKRLAKLAKEFTAGQGSDM